MKKTLQEDCIHDTGAQKGDKSVTSSLSKHARIELSNNYWKLWFSLGFRLVDLLAPQEKTKCTVTSIEF